MCTPRTNKIHPHLFVDLVLTIDSIRYRKSAYVHKMVAECFVLNIDNKPFVSHKDFDYNNNHYSNLYWSNQSEVSRRTIERYPHLRNNLRDNNIKSGYYDSLRRTFSDKELSEMLFMRFKGLTYQEIANNFNCSLSFVYNYIRINSCKKKANKNMF